MAFIQTSTSALSRALLCSIVACLFFSGCQVNHQDSQQQRSDPLSKHSAKHSESNPETLLQSPNDKRQYQLLELPNELSVLLISDPGSEKSAASLSVFRGSYSDPENREGLAHFLEHMLFLGTKKYPDPEEYGNYISAHGGSNNAYTAPEHTTYFFDIQSEYLEGGLDRFAQFFISPTFDANYVEREKNAVHSEYQLQLKDDGWRGQSVSRKLFNPDHPGSRFIIGSLNTLAGDVRTDLLSFAKNNYSANQMALVVLGSKTLSELREWVTRYFSEIPNTKLNTWESDTFIFANDSLPKSLNYKTIQKGQHLEFNFPVPESSIHYLQKPGIYITNLLGHEGKGSLHHVLRSRGWIETLGAGETRYDSKTGGIQIHMALTHTGAQHIPEIQEMLFAYISLIKSEGIARWRYMEQSRIADLGLAFQEKGSAQGYVSMLSPRFRLYPKKHLLAANYLMQDFNKQLILSYINLLTPNNMIMVRSGPDLNTNETEAWFKVPYSIETPIFGNTNRQAAFFGMALPLHNIYLPDDLTIHNSLALLPSNRINHKGLKTWYAPDSEFRVPRANIRIAIDTREGNISPEDTVRSVLHARLVNHKLNTLTYPAQLAGLHYSVNSTSSGFQISLGGYNQKQALLLKQVLKVFPVASEDLETFKLYQQELVRNWDNSSSQRPYAQSMSALGHLLVSDRWPPTLLSDEVKKVDLDNLQSWVNNSFAEVSVRVLQHGNINEETADEILNTLTRHLSLRDFNRQETKVSELKQSAALPLQVDHPDSALVAYVQSSNNSLSSRAYYALSSQLISQPYYHQLRTEQQLGYVVACMSAVLRTTPGLAFVIQSPTVSSKTLLLRTQDFLESFPEILDKMGESDFEQHKSSLIVQLTEKDKNLGSRTARYWSDMDLEVWSFDSRKKIADELSKISKSDYQAFFQELSKDFESRRLVIYSKGAFNTVPVDRKIENIIEVKMSGEI